MSSRGAGAGRWAEAHSSSRRSSKRRRCLWHAATLFFMLEVVFVVGVATAMHLALPGAPQLLVFMRVSGRAEALMVVPPCQ